VLRRSYGTQASRHGPTSMMESKGSRQTCKRGAYSSADSEYSGPLLLTNEPRYAGGGVDGLHTSYAAQHKRQHVGPAIGQDISLPKSPWSAPDHSRPALESQAAAVQSLCRRSGGSSTMVSLLCCSQLSCQLSLFHCLE